MILRIIFENPYRLVCVLKAWQFFRKESQKEQWVVSKADLNWQVEFKKVFLSGDSISSPLLVGLSGEEEGGRKEEGLFSNLW